MRKINKKASGLLICSWSILALVNTTAVSGAGEKLGETALNHEKDVIKSNHSDIHVGQSWTPRIWTEFEKDPQSCRLHDFSYAGYRFGAPIKKLKQKIYKASDFGAAPNDGKEDSASITKALEAAGASGGGVVLLADGQYDINIDGKAPKWISIEHSNVTLRGKSRQNTLIKLHHKQGENESGARIIQVRPKKRTFRYAQWSVSKDCPRHSLTVPLGRVEGLKKGMIVSLYMYNPSVNKKRTDALSRELVAPLQPMKEWAYFARFAPFCWVVEIASVDKLNNEVRLAQPLPIKLNMKWRPKLVRRNTIEEIRIENLTLDSAWQGPYRHHLNKEADYGWSGVMMHEGVQNSIIQNVTIRNFTQDIDVRGKNITVRNIEVYGRPGHSGVASFGWDNLIENIHYTTSRTHVLGASGCAIGNVFRNVRVDAPRSTIDHHGGGFAMLNLFENVSGPRIDGAGAAQNMPHAGPGNVYWNLSCDHGEKAKHELFSGCWNYYSDYLKRGKKYRKDCHKLFPRSIVVGVHPQKGKRQLHIDANDKDRNNAEIYVEGLNRTGCRPRSLYEAQLGLRLKKQKLNQ